MVTYLIEGHIAKDGRMYLLDTGMLKLITVVNP